MSSRISPYKKGDLRFPEDDERRKPSEVKRYILSEAEREELNRKYPPKPERMDPGVRILATMYKDRAEKLAREREEREKKEVEKVANNREPKITKEQLFEECMLHGTNTKAAKIIAEKYGLKWQTVYTYIAKWGVREELGATEVRKSVKQEKETKLAQKVDQEPENVFQIKYTRTARRDDIANMVQGIANVIRSLEDTEYEFRLEVSQVEGRRGA